MARQTKALLVRMTDDGHVVLDRLADEMQLPKAEIVRRAVQTLAGQGGIVAGDERVALITIAESLRAIGTNLNQIARRLNTSGEVDAEALGAALTRLIDVNAATRMQMQQLTGQTRQRMIAGISSSAAP